MNEVYLSLQHQFTVKAHKMKVGDRYKNKYGYTWTITEKAGTSVVMESKEPDGQVLKAKMPSKDLKTLTACGIYTKI